MYATTYTVLSHLQHDGQAYFEGDKLDLSDSDAGMLLAIGVIRKATDAEAATAIDDENKNDSGKPGKAADKAKAETDPAKEDPAKVGA